MVLVCVRGGSRCAVRGPLVHSPLIVLSGDCVGYARVSTTEQETALQLDALRRAGVTRIFVEKGSSVGSRPVLQSCLQDIGVGQTLIVWKLDRLARSLQDLLNILSRLDTAGAGIRSLSEPIDTSTPAGRLMIHILGAVAQFERSLITERSIAGQRAAMARGVICGRRRSIDRATEADIVRAYLSGDYTLRSLAYVFDVHESTVKRAVYRVIKPGHSSLRLFSPGCIFAGVKKPAYAGCLAVRL